ncbi:hypothetical protein [Parasutterella muris]|uniref:Uncharacterized protein n=1 Tax=Parasutterella muris TaxID=2565572 RepID=A0A6L6YIU7_9BURK|nr:hypothetical protein [Parasutterella muris]MVX56782.1 hypothetical protein [Parasutterella muris]
MKIDTAFLFTTMFASAVFTIDGGRYEELFVKSLAYGWILLCFLNALYWVLKNYYYKLLKGCRKRDSNEK